MNIEKLPGKIAFWVLVKVPMLVSMSFVALLPVLFLIWLLTQNDWSVKYAGLGLLVTVPLAFLGAFALWKTRFLTTKLEWSTITRVAVYTSASLGLLLIVLAIVGYILGAFLILALIAVGAD